MKNNFEGDIDKRSFKDVVRPIAKCMFTKKYVNERFVLLNKMQVQILLELHKTTVSKITSYTFSNILYTLRHG